MADRQSSYARAKVSTSYDSWFSPVSASASAESGQDHRTTVESSVDDTSESKAQVKANLTGEVKVNFKSDYLPMDGWLRPT